MTNEEMVNLYQKGEKSIINEIIKQNVNLVHFVLGKLIGIPRNHADYEDMFQAGCIGLIRAALTYNVESEASFSTYATFWIKSCTERESGNLRSIRFPAYVKSTMWKIKRVEEEYEKKNVKYADADIAELCGISQNKYRKIKEAQQDVLSLDSPLKECEHEDTFLIDMIPDLVDIETEVTDAVLIESLLSILIEVLTEREYDIICCRFGLEGKEVMTLDQIGEKYHLSRERIRQIEESALKKLRKSPMLRDAV